MLNDKEPLILAVETATRGGSVCIARGATVLASAAGDASSSHSSDLIGNMERVLDAARLELHHVNVFAAAVGPGSFTGLRIGLATVKALAVSINRPCTGVSTLAAVAAAAGESPRTIALLTAGRGEVFAQMFAVDGESVVPLDDATHLSPELLLARYGSFRTLRWAGEGAHRQFDNLRAAAEERGLEFNSSAGQPLLSGWSIAPPQDKLAEAIAGLAFREWLAGRLVEPHELKAEYLRASDAEIKTHV